MADRKVSPTISTGTAENNEIPEEYEEEMYVPHLVPPDGGWGWVVVAASFFCNLIVDGIIFSFGTFLPDLSTEFNCTKSQVSWIGSLLSGFYLMSGPFVSAMANRWDFRTVTIAGSVISCIAFLVSSFATSISYLYISYGIVGGIGFGMIYMPAVISASYYFEKKRALATGIAVCGSGIGTFLMAPFCTYLMDIFSWQGTFILQAGLALNCAVFGALFRPLEPIEVPQPIPEIKVEEAPQEDPSVLGTPLLQRIQKAREADRKTWVSTESFTDCPKFVKGSTHELTSSINNKLGVIRNGNIPYDINQRRKSTTDMDPMKLHPYVKRGSEPFIHGRVRGSSVAKAIMERRNLNRSSRNKLPTFSAELLEDYHHSADQIVPALKESEVSFPKPSQRRHSSNLQGTYRDSELDVVAEAAENSSSSNSNGQESPTPALSSQETLACSQQQCNVMDTNENISENTKKPETGSTIKMEESYRIEEEYKRIRRMSHKEAMRPFYRNDIFYSGSLLKLPQYKSATSVEQYHASVTQLPFQASMASQTLNTYKPLLDEQGNKEEMVCCPASCTIVINTLLDFSLMKSPTFMALAGAGFLTMIGFFIPFMYLADRAIMMGIEKDAAAFLLSVIGITNTGARMVCGFFADRTNVPALLLNNLALAIGGLATIAVPHLGSYTTLVIYCCVFGFSIACFASLRAIIVVDLMGLDKLNNAFGLLLFFQGIAATIGSPLVGVFFDLTQSYDVTFYIAGAMLAVSGLMLFPLPRLNKWEIERNERLKGA